MQQHLPKLLALLALALWPALADAQVRQDVAGNNQPSVEQSTAPTPGALPPGHSPDDGHDHSQHGHDHAGHDHSGHDHAAHDEPEVLGPQQHILFAQGVKLDEFRKLAVFDTGRAKIIDTLAREQVERITGRTAWKDPRTGHKYDPVFTYLDLIFNQRFYHDQPVVHVEVLALRQALVRALVDDQTKREHYLMRAQLTPAMMATREAAQVLSGLNSDLRLVKAQNQVRSAVMSLDRVGGRLMMVSPPEGSDQWAHVMQLRDHLMASAQASDAIAAAPLADSAAAQRVLEGFQKLSSAWPRGDTASVNAALAQLTEAIPNLNPTTYPAPGLRQAEYVYNATGRFTLGYVAYLLGAVVLLIAFGVQRKSLIIAGISLVGLGLLIHTAGVVVRMVLADRGWMPLHNQYESYIAIAWFAVVAGIILMLVKRQWLFGAAAGAVGAGSLMFANLYAIPSAEIGQVAGILATSNVLKVHVTIILTSYGLIALAFVVSIFYLAVHYLAGRETVQIAAAGLGKLDEPGEGEAAKQPGRHALLRDLDRAQMVVLQLAFWTLGVGILLGAYWADHAWGRWWAWDPKETWALITWIVYLIVIHMRFSVKNRGLTTAWLSVLGFFVMLWTYWGVNLLLAGLHSYA